jgi:hypothetical protein
MVIRRLAQANTLCWPGRPLIEASVSCGIPGHDHRGGELVHETLKVEDDPLSFEFRGRCGFAAHFDYHV